jgi:hypothetical protein
MADSIPLDPALVAELAPLPRPFAAVQILTSRGPLAEAGAGFGRDVAELAYLLWLVYRQARRPGGMLSGRPGWEALATYASRVRSSRHVASSLATYGDRLMRSCRVKPEAVLRDGDLLWWRGLCATDDAARLWRGLRDPIRLEEAITALGLLDGWMWDFRRTAGEMNDTDNQEPTS